MQLFVIAIVGMSFQKDEQGQVQTVMNPSGIIIALQVDINSQHFPP